ncbi:MULTISPECIES: IucA/IucC family protein [unclassified Ensifer]|uniref:IucA/IucC family protein n=1 Tax=unclassified Ensifer TaxID=2633371 RepID=UPI00081359C4|nr:MULTISPECIES: IucA/IucC family protein [unclassified Ensifer]OCP00455.1 rhizobactin siderophore biosynthesis protein RhsF [Ensifer sp. LC14]OCP05830.1 rhizobactin siderophore biosynthesis protein RhsF [Ensifer sp. LC11]OCP06574.1 rhizobactin siderophore biosynthesis protein RhsF [Ensifer sp. LC13]OCP31186.1 rhizobactin siderophore biosynthesis protein RhsF [Ensifer sp. LC499]
MPLPLDLKARPDERVLRQLVSALLFEGIVPAYEHADNGVTTFHWSLGGQDFRCRGSVGPFGRLRLVAGSVEMREDTDGWIVPPLAQLVSALPGSGPTRGKLLDELTQTVAFCRWNERHLPERPRRAMPFAALEGALDEGHPYHPCYKARTGFSFADHAAFGPEAGRAFQLVWLLVARKQLHQAIPGNDDTFWQAELGQETWSHLQSMRQQHGAAADDFGLVPLHPWQWRELRETQLAGWIASGDVHFLGPAGDRYTATQSVRSLLNQDRPLSASLKLPLNIVNTSSRRTLEPHSVCTAPVISRWIAGIVANDAVFGDRYPLTVLQEYAGVIADRDGPLAGQVAAIWRESAEAALAAGEAVIPFNALMMVEADERPFADDWIARFGLMPWINRLIEIAVLPVWHLLVHHGLAVEAHGQNMLLVHRDGWPVRLILRDFHESIEFSPDFLREPEKAPDFAALDPVYRDAEPDRFYWTDNLDSLRELVMDTLFVFNLSEISHLLDHAYNLPEALFWQRVGSALAAYEAEHAATERLAQLGCDQPRILTESLMTRKLLAAKPEYHHTVPNTLAAPTLQRRRKS